MGPTIEMATSPQAWPNTAGYSHPRKARSALPAMTLPARCLSRPSAFETTYRSTASALRPAAAHSFCLTAGPSSYRASACTLHAAKPGIGNTDQNDRFNLFFKSEPIGCCIRIPRSPRNVGRSPIKQISGRHGDKGPGSGDRPVPYTGEAGKPVRYGRRAESPSEIRTPGIGDCPQDRRSAVSRAL